MHWAALRGDQVIAIISMRVPRDVDFEEYRRRAVAALELLGEVRAGEVFDDYGDRYFVKRRNHANRSKNPKPDIPLRICQPSELYEVGGAI
jgi:hypothetical protein